MEKTLVSLVSGELASVSKMSKALVSLVSEVKSYLLVQYNNVRYFQMSQKTMGFVSYDYVK